MYLYSQCSYIVLRRRATRKYPECGRNLNTLILLGGIINAGHVLVFYLMWPLSREELHF